jgi:DNA invertase Pin-like site-specific DNA recombinase
MNVAAYLRKTLTGVTVRAQRETLEARARDRDWTIVWEDEDPAVMSNRGVKRIDHFCGFLNEALTDSRVKIQGVMFWHAGHVAGSLDGFLELIQLLDALNLAWYMEHPRIDSDGDPGRMLVSLSSELRGIHDEITRLSLRERSADMKARGTNPGRQKLSAKMEEDIRFLKRNGFSIREISRQVKVSYATINKVIKQADT